MNPSKVPVDFDIHAVQSVQEKKWRAPAPPSAIVHALRQDYDLPHEIAEIVASRITCDPSSALHNHIEYFLYPKMRKNLPEPYTLDAMETAVFRTQTAISRKEKIGIICDYDVDGTTSGAILIRYLRAVNIEPAYYVPDRLQEGYGPNKNAIETLKHQHQVSLLFTLDCGTNSHDSIQLAKEYGIDTIVIDHHQTEPQLPPVAAMINPKKPDDSSGLDTLASVGLVFLFLVALNRVLRDTEQFQEPDLLKLLDLVALGTVCDMVPLVGVNRMLVKQGLHIMRHSAHQGVRSLMRASGIRNYPSARDLGFSLGPPINAASRIGQSPLALQLLTTVNEDEAQTIANQLIKLNKERQHILEKNMANFVLDPETIAKSNDSPFVHIAHTNIHLGVAGLLASRIVLQQKKPAFVSAIDPHTQTVKGSVRSVEGFDVGTCLHNAKLEGILESAGGHTMAGGYRLDVHAIPAFNIFLQQYLARFPVKDTPQTITADVFLPSFSYATIRSLSDKLSLIEPFGMHNSEPVLLLTNVLCHASILRDGPHMICNIAPADNPKSTIRVMAFHAAGSPLGLALLDLSPHAACHHALVAIAGPSSYNGKPSLRLIDIGSTPLPQSPL